MIKIGIIAALIMLSPVLSYAHPARSIDVSFSGKEVSVTVMHSVGTPTKHYIDKIIVELNGAQVVSQVFSSQMDNEQKVKYVIPSLKKGDVVNVKTHCNKSGDLNKEVVY